jgi:hypothetical protein
MGRQNTFAGCTHAQAKAVPLLRHPENNKTQYWIGFQDERGTLIK